jgi:serine/threonine protein kinase
MIQKILDLTDKVLDQKYRVDKLHHESNMALVYQGCRDIHDDNCIPDQKIAIKIMLKEDQTALQRFENEARITHSLRHENIVVLDTGRYVSETALSIGGKKQTIYYIVLAWVDGQSLREKITYNRDHNASPDRRLNQAVEFLTKVSSPLDFIHRQGIIHRDIKPSNIMFDKREKLYLLDFGVAKNLKSDEPLTVTNPNSGEKAVPGTPDYIAPERWISNLDSAACDQYALALTVYQLLTNNNSPFKESYEEYSQKPKPGTGSNSQSTIWREIHTKYRNGEIKPTPIHKHCPQLPKEVWTVLQKAMDSNPKNRYQNITDFAYAFKEAANKEPRSMAEAETEWNESGELPLIKPKSSVSSMSRSTIILALLVLISLLGAGVIFSCLSSGMCPGILSELAATTPTSILTPTSTSCCTPTTMPVIINTEISPTNTATLPTPSLTYTLSPTISPSPNSTATATLSPTPTSTDLPASPPTPPETPLDPFQVIDILRTSISTSRINCRDFIAGYENLLVLAPIYSPLQNLSINDSVEDLYNFCTDPINPERRESTNVSPSEDFTIRGRRLLEDALEEAESALITPTP